MQIRPHGMLPETEAMPEGTEAGSIAVTPGPIAEPKEGVIYKIDPRKRG